MGAHFDYPVVLLGIIIETIARGVRTAWGYGAGKRTGDSAARACTGLHGQARTLCANTVPDYLGCVQEKFGAPAEGALQLTGPGHSGRAPTSNSQIAPSAGPARTRLGGDPGPLDRPKGPSIAERIIEDGALAFNCVPNLLRSSRGR